MSDQYRLNLTLDPTRADVLQRLAEKSHLKEGTLARSLLSTVLDQLDVAAEAADSEDPANIVEVLNGIPGALQRAQLGAKQATQGQATPLNQW